MPGSYLSRRMLLALGAGLAARPVFAQEAPPDPKAPAVSEDDLLLEVLRYLRADRRQIALLLGIARQTDRRRMVLTQEAERAVKALERTGTEKEIEAGKASIEEGRQRAIADILKFAGPQMVRIFLREQIGLAWRLEQGRPPEYARADASLLPPEAGFVNPNTPWNAYSRVEILRSGDGGLVDLFLNQAPQDGGELAPLLLKSADVSLDIAGVRDARRLYVSDLLTAEHALGGNRPFPQQLVESNNLEELAQQIEPFTRRLFLSERIVPVLEHASAHGLGVMSGGSRAPSGNLKLLRNYRMELGLRDRTGHGPELEPLGGQLINGLYQFEAGQGLRANDLGVTDHYAIDLVFRHYGASGYQKILDFKNGTKDGGLYLYNGSLTFYQLATGGKPEPGQDIRLRLERNRATRVVRASLNGTPVFAFLDLDDDAVFEKRAAWLFLDDQQTKNEQGPGALTSVMVWGPAQS